MIIKCRYDLTPNSLFKTLRNILIYSAPNYPEMTSDRNLADRPYYPVGESYSDASETGEWRIVSTNPNYRSLWKDHRRRIYTESKANSHRFCLGGKIVCGTKNLLSEYVVLCTQLVLFPLLLLDGGMFYVDLYFKFKVRFNYFMYCFIC